MISTVNTPYTSEANPFIFVENSQSLSYSVAIYLQFNTIRNGFLISSIILSSSPFWFHHQTLPTNKISSLQ